MAWQDNNFDHLLSRIQMRCRPKLKSRGYQLKAQVKNAAVLILLVEADKPYLLLTHRSALLKHHANQVCLPGGRQDIGESLFETALRETEEELNIPREQINLLTQMETIETPSGYRIHPFIGYSKQNITAVANPAEVQEIVKITIEDLLAKNILVQEYKMGSRQHRVLSFSHQQLLIWGATAAILDQFKRWLI